MNKSVENSTQGDTATDTLVKKNRDADVISGGHLVAKALKSEGVDTIFTLCGGHIIDIYDGCIDEGIRIIDVRHEQTAAHAADGYARQTGKLGCVVTTAGPGCTNAVTGVATAFRSESPVLHIGGQSSLTQHKMDSLQDLPHVDMMTPITKFASGVYITGIPRLLAAAISILSIPTPCLQTAFRLLAASRTSAEILPCLTIQAYGFKAQP